MSITDELREYAQSWRENPNLMDDLDGGDIDGLLGDFEHIADHIDAEHQKAIRELNNLADNSVLLPVDADGEVIHIGDVMEYPNGGREEVRFATLNGTGWLVNEAGWLPDRLYHYHAPSVEDLLMEFADECLTYATCVEDHEVTDAIERFAAKLRLAGDAE